MTTRTRQLMLEYLNGDLDPGGVAELNRLLKANPALCRSAAEVVVQELHLRAIAQEHSARMKAASQTLTAVTAESARAPWWSHLKEILLLGWRPILAGGAVAVAVCLVAVRMTYPSPQRPSLVKLEGSATVERDGQFSRAEVGVALRQGDHLALNSNSWVLLKYSGEPTSIWLSDSAQVRLDQAGGAKVFTLAEGTLSAAVSPQPGRSPMRILTPTADVTVLGTELGVSARPGNTRLDVWKGKVRLVPKQGGALDVSAGEYTVVARGGEPPTRQAVRYGALLEYWQDARILPSVDLAWDHSFRSQPTGCGYLTRFSAPTNWGDTFTARVRALLRPPKSGEYQFWIAGDDAAELWLSSDDKPEHRRKLCSTTEWTSADDWEKDPSQRSPLVPLETGRQYYIEALQFEGAGADCLAVAWAVPGARREIIPGDYLVAPWALNSSGREKEGRLQ